MASSRKSSGALSESAKHQLLNGIKQLLETWRQSQSQPFPMTQREIEKATCPNAHQVELLHTMLDSIPGNCITAQNYTANAPVSLIGKTVSGDRYIYTFGVGYDAHKKMQFAIPVDANGRVPTGHFDATRMTEEQIEKLRAWTIHTYGLTLTVRTAIALFVWAESVARTPAQLARMWPDVFSYSNEDSVQVAKRNAVKAVRVAEPDPVLWTDVCETTMLEASALLARATLLPAHYRANHPIAANVTQGDVFTPPFVESLPQGRRRELTSALAGGV